MKCLCLVYRDAAHWDACGDQVCADYVQRLVAGQRVVAAEPPHPTHTATTVRVRNGRSPNRMPPGAGHVLRRSGFAGDQLGHPHAGNVLPNMVYRCSEAVSPSDA